MLGDDWGRDEEFWYVDQEKFWVVLLRRRGRVALAAVSAGLLVVVACSFLALSLRAHPGSATGARTNTDPLSGTPTSTSSPTAALPPNMPTHLAFGVMNGLGGTTLLNNMRTHNGTAWDFRYQYLAGGVNTGQDWETWASPAGQFAANYLRESDASGYIPSLVYYELRQSKGTCAGCGDAIADRTNLNDPAVMASYYANWRLLMREVGNFGKPVLVIVEPDLWGFLQQSVVYGSNSAANVPASVASSGDADAAGLTNTAQGFALALLHMRDRYAPNALLTLHVSNWATMLDIGSSTDVSLSVRLVADMTARFLLTAGLSGNPKGISTWDLLSSDASDRDNAQGAAWWDRTNQTFPNFTRYLSFISEVASRTNRRVVMWQVPEGNQYFATMNDSQHHTQDNRPEYILSHLLDIAHAGVVAVLFGPGNGGTSIDDAASDGVTNPHPIASYQCDHCNTHLSTYPDDDGGYLRLFVGAYYRGGPLALAQPDAWKGLAPVDAGSTVTPQAPGNCESTPKAAIGQSSITPNPAHPGQRVTFSVYITLSCNTAVALVIDVYEGGLTKSILKLPDNYEPFTAGQPRTISISGTLPTTAQMGSHSISVGVFDPGYSTLYGFSGATIALQVN